MQASWQGYLDHVATWPPGVLRQQRALFEIELDQSGRAIPKRYRTAWLTSTRTSLAIVNAAIARRLGHIKE